MFDLLLADIKLNIRTHCILRDQDIEGYAGLTAEEEDIIVFSL